MKKSEKAVILIEDIPDEDELYYRIHKVDFQNNKD